MGELAHPLALRAHHLLCLLGFRGLGYSPEFVETMGKVAKDLHPKSTFPITLLAECDVICASCPHNKGNQCRKKANAESKVRAKDREVLRRLGFEVKAEMPVAEAWGRIKERLTSSDIAEICPRCQWRELGYCAEGLERLVTGK
ncbi:MAG: DUF1284 domain-containing protein [Chloroflexi bacterium]|nr:DUF1284 domain-containing protein [Chloroflexota bacterium]